MPEPKSRTLFQSVGDFFSAVNERLRNYAWKNGLAVEPSSSISNHGLVDWLFALFVPVVAFGFIFNKQPRDPSFNICLALVVGASMTAVGFAVARGLDRFLRYGQQLGQARKQRLLSFALGVTFLGLFFTAPGVLLKAASSMLPQYVHPMGWTDAIFAGIYIWGADTLLSRLTGVRLFLASGDRHPAASQPQPPSQSPSDNPNGDSAK